MFAAREAKIIKMRAAGPLRCAQSVDLKWQGLFCGFIQFQDFPGRGWDETSWQFQGLCSAIRQKILNCHGLCDWPGVTFLVQVAQSEFERSLQIRWNADIAAILKFEHNRRYTFSVPQLRITVERNWRVAYTDLGAIKSGNPSEVVQ
jgi:hypothetical protein